MVAQCKDTNTEVAGVKKTVFNTISLGLSG